MSRDDVGGTVGIVPAAGRATRLGSPDASKELLDVYRPSTPGASGSDEPPARIPVVYRLLDAFAEASIRRAYVVTRQDKTDVRARLGEGGGAYPGLVHIVVDESPSPAFSVAAGTLRAREANVALGFPDVLWEGADAFARLIAAMRSGPADVALGLFPPAPDYPTDRVRIEADGRVREFAAPDSRRGSHTWTLAVWSPRFSRLLESLVAERYGPLPPAVSEGCAGSVAEGSPAPVAERGGSERAGRVDTNPGARNRASGSGGELTVTDALAAALEAGFRITGIPISERPFLDVGSPDRLRRARLSADGFERRHGDRSPQ